MPKAATTSHTPRKRTGGFSSDAVDAHTVVREHVGEMNRDRRAAAEPGDVDVAVAVGELLRYVPLRFFDAFVTADAERAAGKLAEESMLGADTFIEVLRSRVEILEPHHVGVPVVLSGILFRVPCTVERV